MSEENSACWIPMRHNAPSDGDVGQYVVSDEDSACWIPMRHKTPSDGDVGQ